MNFQFGQHLKTSQNLTLAPRIIQTMEILQLALPALEEKIDQELESNIALELVEPEPVDSETVQDDIEDSENEFSRLDEFEHLSGADISDLPPRITYAADKDSKFDAISNIRARQESLSEQLMHQWSFAEVTENIRTAGKCLIGMLDRDGFLTSTDNELISLLDSDIDVAISSEELYSIIRDMQKWLEPPGIAARSLQESLLIQVNTHLIDDPEGWADVAVVLETHLDDLVANRLPRVATSTGIGIERVKIAIEKMHELTISPGQFLATERVLPVIPDAFIQFDDIKDRYVVGITHGRVPALRISNQYQTLTSDPHSDEETKIFIQRNINAARWIIEAVDQRKKTLQNIVQIVADRQRYFLDKGDAFLRPLPMVEVADMLGIHVATVSRAVSDKWVQTPRGIFTLRRFFSGGTGSASSGDMSWEAVKSRLKEIVDGENKKKPYSDVLLSKKLQEQGIDIARRTVVKYRQQLGLPAARLRKEF